MKLKPVPLAAICEMVTADPPEFVSVWESVLLLAAATFPKLRLLGFAASTAGVPAGVTPMPERAISKVGLSASLTKLSPPLRMPDDRGAKLTVNVAV